MAKLSTGMKRQRLRNILKRGKPRKMKPKWGNKWKRVVKSGSGRRLR